jgi:hypothetical protein
MKLLDNERVKMSGKTCFATIFVAVLCFLTSGCFNIEHEIFLEPDGSGDMVMYISMPDIPAAMSEAMMKDASNPQQELQKLFDEVKQKFANELPPAIKLKEAKEVRRHGAFAYYIVLRFNQLNDINSMIDKFAKESLGKAGMAQSAASNIESFWKIQLEKAGDLTMIAQSLYFDFEAMGAAMEMGKRESAKSPSDSPAPGKSQASVRPKSGSKPARKAPTRRTAPIVGPIVGVVAPKEDPAIDDKMKELFSEGMISVLVSSILKMRFVLHTPKKIAETNADIVLNGNIAIWNASLGAFIKEKKPIEMKVTY